jgi:hypothetical protein
MSGSAINCPCYPDCEILPDGRCLNQHCVEVILREQERVIGNCTDQRMAEENRSDS